MKVEFGLTERLAKKLNALVEYCKAGSKTHDGINYAERTNQRAVIGTLIECINIEPYIAAAVYEFLEQEEKLKKAE